MVDASAAGKWFVPEPDQAAARAVLGDTRALLAPALARVEVATALMKKAQREEMAPEACAKALDLWRRTLAADRPVLVPESRISTLAAAWPGTWRTAAWLPLPRPSIRLDLPLVAGMSSRWLIEVSSTCTVRPLRFRKLQPT